MVSDNLTHKFPSPKVEHNSTTDAIAQSIFSMYILFIMEFTGKDSNTKQIANKTGKKKKIKNTGDKKIKKQRTHKATATDHYKVLEIQ